MILSYLGSVGRMTGAEGFWPREPELKRQCLRASHSERGEDPEAEGWGWFVNTLLGEPNLNQESGSGFAPVSPAAYVIPPSSAFVRVPCKSPEQSTARRSKPGLSRTEKGLFRPRRTSRTTLPARVDGTVQSRKCVPIAQQGRQRTNTHER